MTATGDLYRKLAEADEARDLNSGAAIAGLAESIAALAARVAALEKPVVVPPPVVPPVIPPSNGLVKGQDNSAIASLPKPTRATPQKDPAYGLTIWQATAKGDSDNKAVWVRNDYSRRQAFNADETHYLGVAQDGYWWLYSTATRLPIMRLPNLAGSCEPIWHPTDPTKLYFHAINGGPTLSLLTINAAAKTATAVVVADFKGKLPWSDATRCWMKDEGAPSADGRYWCFQAETDGFAIRGAFVYDLVDGKVLGTKSLTARPDHTSMSPCGKYAVLSGDGADGTAAYRREDFSLHRKLHHKSEHSDLGLLPNGNSFYVAIDYQSAAGDVFYTNVETGEKKVLFPTYGGSTTAIHFSAKAYKRPGLAAVSTYGQGGTKKWFHEKAFLLDVVTGEISNLAHHRTKSGTYYSEPHATISPSGKRVLFNSNWGGSDADHGAFLLELP